MKIWLGTAQGIVSGTSCALGVQGLTVSAASVLQRADVVRSEVPFLASRGNRTVTATFTLEREHDNEGACDAHRFAHVLLDHVPAGGVWLEGGGYRLVWERAFLSGLRSRSEGLRSWCEYEVTGAAVSVAVTLAPVLSGMVSGLAIVWSWTAVPGAEAYRLYLRVGGGAWELHTINTELAVDSGDYEASDTVEGKVYPVFAGVEGPVSNVASVDIPAV